MSEFRYSVAGHEVLFNEADHHLIVRDIQQDLEVKTFYIGPGENELSIHMDGDEMVFEVSPNQAILQESFDCRSSELLFGANGGVLTVDIRDALREGEPPVLVNYPLDPDDPNLAVKIRFKDDETLVIQSFQSNS